MRRSCRSRRRRARGSTNCGRHSRVSRSSHATPPRRRDSMSTGCSRCRASARSPPARCGRARSRRATCCEPSRRAKRCACARCRCTTRRSSEAEAGQRVAVNLPAVGRRDLARGDVLVEPGHYPVSYRLDIRLEALQEVPAAVTVHVGTAAVPARVARDGDVRAAPAPGARGRCARRPRRAAHGHDGRRRRRARPCPHRVAWTAVACRRWTTERRRRSWQLSCANRSRQRSCRHTGCSLRPSSRAAWLRFPRPATTTSRLRGWPRRVQTCTSGSLHGRRRARSTPGCRWPNCCRTSRGRRQSSACSRSSAATRRRTCPVRRLRSAIAPERLLDSRRSSPTGRS